MNAIKVEVEKPDSSTDRRLPSPGDPVAMERTGRTDEGRTRHFSPDPMDRTDRYRLVTPYRLPRID